MTCMFFDVRTEVSTAIFSVAHELEIRLDAQKCHGMSLLPLLDLEYWHKDSTSTAMYQYLALTMTNAWHIGWQGYGPAVGIVHIVLTYVVTCTRRFVGMFWPHGLKQG